VRSLRSSAVVTVVLAAVAAGAAAPAFGGTITKVDKTKTKIMVQLTDEEAEVLEPDMVVLLKDEETGQEARAVVKRVRRGEALIQMERPTLAKGVGVTMAVVTDDKAAPAASAGTPAPIGPAAHELLLQSAPTTLASLDRGSADADDTTIALDGLYPVAAHTMVLSYYKLIGPLGLGPELGFLSVTKKIGYKVHSEPPEGGDGDVVETEGTDKLTTQKLQAGLGLRYVVDLAADRSLGFLMGFGLGAGSESAKSANFNSKSSSFFFRTAFGLRGQLSGSVALSAAFELRSEATKTRAIQVSETDDGADAGTGELSTDETTTVVGLTYGLGFVF
jgi:hypothetical protein